MLPIDPKLLNLFSILWSLSQNLEQKPDSKTQSEPATAPQPVLHSRVEQRLDQLLLVVQAMWTLVQEKTGLTDAELMVRVTELDARDGTTDGQVIRPPVQCGKCGAAIARKFNRCLFCGEPYSAGSAFDTV